MTFKDSRLGLGVSGTAREHLATAPRSSPHADEGRDENLLAILKCLADLGSGRHGTSELLKRLSMPEVKVAFYVRQLIDQHLIYSSKSQGEREFKYSIEPPGVKLLIDAGIL